MTDDREPDWLDTIRNRVLQPRSGGPEPSVNGALRRAAILVLLVDSDDGPNLLLTERAAALANYPGILVFPGGSAETIDDGPIATALREAAEETGIDPAHVHVIGSLPPLHLPETGFLVNPVVGWCTRLQLANTLNPQEVAVVVQIPLREFAKTSDRVQRNRATDTNGFRFSVDGTAVGDMTSIVIEALLEPPTMTPGRRRRPAAPSRSPDTPNRIRQSAVASGIAHRHEPVAATDDAGNRQAHRVADTTMKSKEQI